MEGAALRILLVVEAQTATQEIAFLRAIAAEGATAGMSVHVAPMTDQWRDSRHLAALWSQVHPDVIVMSRCFDRTSMGWIDLARQAGVPIVYHLDDDLLDVPETIGPAKYAYYHDPERKAALRALIDSSDLIYASTAPLAKILASHGLKPPIHHGPLSCSANPEQFREPLPALCPVIGYMATAGHVGDLEMIVPAIADIMELIPTVQFETFGGVPVPSALARFTGRTRQFPAVKDYDQFLSTLASLGWWVGIAPLIDNGFNRCKADIKWLEYTMAGIPCVASRTDVYRKARDARAITTASTLKQWREGLMGLLLDEGERTRIVTCARQEVQERVSHPAMLRQIRGMVSAAGRVLRHEAV